MTRFVLRRLAYALLTIWGVSFVAFVIIQLPPGDFLTTSIDRMGDEGLAGEAQIEALRNQYGLDQPLYVQYFKWISGIVLHGDFGQSFVYHRPVAELIWQRLPMTLALSVLTILFTWLIAVPIGIYSAVRQYSLADYVVTILGFIGLAVPSFLIALVLLYVSYRFLGQDVGGLFSEEYVNAPWSFGRVVDLLQHMWIPVIITGLAGTATLIRVMRANLLDELRKPYVAAARARGNSEGRLIVKYPVRVAIAPLISSISWVLPAVISSGEVVAVVLSLQTTGPMLLSSLQTQDMYLAGSLIFVISVLAVLGTLLSDLMLGWSDPRIRHQYA